MTWGEKHWLGHEALLWFTSLFSCPLLHHETKRNETCENHSSSGGWCQGFSANVVGNDDRCGCAGWSPARLVSQNVPRAEVASSFHAARLVALSLRWHAWRA